MLRIKQTLQDIRGLQKELAAIGVDMALSDPVGEDAVACISIPDLEYVEEQHILPDGGFYDGFTRQEVAFDEYRLRIIERLTQYYEGEARSVADKWKELCGGEDMPLPDDLQARRESLADTAERLCELIKGKPPEPCAFDYSLLEKIARDPQAHVASPDGDYRRLKGMGLVIRGYRFPDAIRCDGLTGVRVHRWTLADGTVVTSPDGWMEPEHGEVSQTIRTLTGHHLVIPNSAVLYVAD